MFDRSEVFITQSEHKDGSKEVRMRSGAVFKFRLTEDGCDALTGIYTIDGRHFRVCEDHNGKYTADYKVQPGDSLYRIVEDWLIHHGMLSNHSSCGPILRETLRRAVEYVAAANGIDAPAGIYAGQSLSILGDVAE